MSKRKERFCDMTVKGLLRESEVHPLAVDGRCVEPAVGKCSQCLSDYCYYHEADGTIQLKLHFEVMTWRIPLCKDCAEIVYQRFQKKGILPRRLATSFQRISREVAQWLGKKGHYAPKEKPKVETAPIEQQGPSEVK